MRSAVLAGISLKEERFETEARLQECEHLCEACGIEVKARVTQQSNSLEPRTAFRKGKLEELSACAAETEADLVIFDRELPIAVLKRISEACGVPVIDRTSLILDIFSRRARSRQAKLQVELARLLYALPRTAPEDDSEQHARGGGYRTRGAGESRTAQIARTSRKRIAALRKELAEVERDYHVAERRRGKSELSRAALVGYTNAGKSSLMNALLAYNGNEERQVFVKDILFATLDSSVRRISFQGREFLLYDTVGFVSNLPHTLIEAFHSTLDSARNADLLIHVADASDPGREEKMHVTRETLRTIHADDIPLLTVYTKADLVKDGRDLFDGISVSSLTGEGIGELLARITDTLYPAEETLYCLLPYEKGGLIQDLSRTVQIEILNHTETGYYIKASGPKLRLGPLKEFETTYENSLEHV
ncbi:MAG: GTPase HflX [Solobacterium sp.]|nr:GTPase HflX [Solobacterium sp.]